MRWDNLVEFLLLQTKMNLQDEIDKETLSLVGLKPGKNEENKAMYLNQVNDGMAQLDANCLTCGQLNVTERNHVYK